MVLRASVIDSLDEALVAVQRIPRRPGYRRRLVAPLELPGGLATFRVLRAVERLSPDPTIGEVAEALAIDPSTASRAVDRCVAEGLVAREAGLDRRKTHLQLTDAGREVLTRVTRNRRRLLTEVAGDWDEGEVAQLVTRLRLLLEGFDRIEADA